MSQDTSGDEGRGAPVARNKKNLSEYLIWKYRAALLIPQSCSVGGNASLLLLKGAACPPGYLGTVEKE